MDHQKTVLVTGANQGIGLEVCRQFLQKDFIVYLAARKKAEGEKAVAELSVNNKPVHFLLMDVTNAASINKAVKAFGKKSSSLDVLVNNAGVMLDTTGSILNTPVETFEQTFLTNTLGAVQVTRAFLPYLKSNGSARIVNVSSGAGMLTEMQSFAPAYSVSKTALNAVTRQFAAELKPTIAVNSICPGWVRTKMGGKDAPLSVEQGADVIVWLATEASFTITGQFLRERKKIDW